VRPLLIVTTTCNVYFLFYSKPCTVTVLLVAIMLAFIDDICDCEYVLENCNSSFRKLILENPHC